MKAKSKLPNLDTVTTINEDGSRFNIHPADVRGRFTRWRRIAALLLIGVYILLPWIPVNGYPAVFLDVLHRRFHLFGITLAAQDLWLLFFFLSGMAFLLFYITAFLGRVWCGWACPQTVFLEHVFRRIERFIEGDAPARRKLDAAPMTPPKLFKRVLKHGIFLILATIIAHIFLSFFISIPQLWEWIRTSPVEHWKAFFFIIITTLLLYGNFAWFREQLCIVICPYGRFQSALIDDDTLNVAYDYGRGNPPGSVKNPEAGDCIDCRRCVQVCPTGIDIRDGVQLECIGCALCIDACDEVMEKMNYPKGLIRYTTENELEGKTSKLLRPRTFGYGAVLILMISAVIFTIATRVPAKMDVLRDRGALFSFNGEGRVENSYTVKIQNMSEVPQTFSLSVDGLEDMRILTDTTVTVSSGENLSLPTVVDVPPEALVDTNNDIRFYAESQPDSLIKLETESRFVGPRPR